MRVLSYIAAIMIGCSPISTACVDTYNSQEDINFMSHILGLITGSAASIVYNTGLESSIRYIRDEVSPDTYDNLEAYLTHELLENSIITSASTITTTLCDLVCTHMHDAMRVQLDESDRIFIQTMYNTFNIVRVINVLSRINAYANHHFHPTATPDDPKYYDQAYKHRDRNNMVSVHNGILLAQALEYLAGCKQ